MILRSTHRTLYRYATPSVDSHNEVRLTPLTDENQICRSFSIYTSPPTKIFCHEEIGGTVHHFSLRGPHRQLEIVAEAEVQTLRSNPYDGVNLIEPDWSYYSSGEARQKYAEYLVASTYVGANAEAAQIAQDVKTRSGPAVADFLVSLNRYLNGYLDYDPDVTHVHTTVDEVLELKAGVCQDFAHLMIACCRSQGIPARYVSGYLYGDGDDLGMRGYDAMHAWLECPLPDGRWLALDPTNNILANDRYVRVHVGRDYSEVAPTRGLYMGAPALSLDVTLEVHALSLAAIE